MNDRAYKIDFVFGAERDKEGNFIGRDERAAAIRLIRKEAAQIFGAYTLELTFGGWKDGVGSVIEEEGRNLWTVVRSEPGLEGQWDGPIGQLAYIIKAQLNQASVMVSITPVEWREY